MSHHFDSAADRADGRINLCDLYVFPGGPGTTVLILTVNPDAGRSSGTTFRPDAVYEFVLASDAGASPSNVFAGRYVTAIALQLPNAALGGTRLSVWARISVLDHIPPRQVNRIGQAMFRPLFFNAPDSEAEMDALNAGPPAHDRDTYGERVRTIAGTIARLAGLPDPDGHAVRVAEAFLPDVVTYQPGQPATFHPGGGNGRALGDNAFDHAVAVLAGSALGNSSTPPPATEAFPYTSAPRPAELPPLTGGAATAG